MSPVQGTFLRHLDLQADKRLVVAVSGGSDSLALLLLTKAFFGGASASKLVAVTVDHRLRAEAEAEAAQVAVLCGRLGIPHRIMRWDGPKPRTGLIAAARDARYALLADAAQDAGADAILTAHTMDDQAETVAMRAERGEGSGLAGMAPSTLFDDRIWIVRPLLGVRRQALRAYLRDLGQDWIDDPTNEDPAYERVRMRARLGVSGRVEDIAAEAVREGDARRDLARRAADILDAHASQPAPGLFRLSSTIFDAFAADEDAAVHSLRFVLALAGGTPFPADTVRTRALRLRLQDGSRLRATLSRALVDARKDGVWVMREARGLPPASQADPHGLWDGRWRIGGGKAADRPVVGPAGKEVAERLAPAYPDLPQSLVRKAISAEPAFYRAEGPWVLASSLEAARLGTSAEPAVAPFARFLPDFDLQLAVSLRKLAGAGALPATPLKDHIGSRA